MTLSWGAQGNPGLIRSVERGSIGALEDFLENFTPKPLTATASRDLKQGVDSRVLSKSGNNALTTYLFL